MKISKNIIKLFTLCTFILPTFVTAQGVTPPPTPIVINIPNPTTAGSSLMEVLNAILLNIVEPIAAVAVVIWIIWAGFGYVLAQGNPAKIEKAHQRLLWSLIGAGILLGAAGISVVVQKTVEALM